MNLNKRQGVLAYVENGYLFVPLAHLHGSAPGEVRSWALVKGEWKALDWCYPTGSGPCTFVIELKPEYEALGFPLWTNQQGRWVWVQSVDIYGVNAVCTMAYKCPEIDKVEVERGGELGGWRVRVYVKSPSQRMSLQEAIELLEKKAPHIAEILKRLITRP